MEKYIGIFEYNNPSRYYHVIEDKGLFYGGECTNVGFRALTNGFETLDALDAFLSNNNI